VPSRMPREIPAAKNNRIRFVSASIRFKNAREEITKALLSDIPTVDESKIINAYQLSRRTLGPYVTLDWEHRDQILNLIHKIKSYARDETRKRPLNIMMQAEPGSGKSHFINCIAEALDYFNVSAVSFNMGSLQTIDDLSHPLEAIRNLKVVDKLPILFLDEFDSDQSRFPMLLPLLWDGELHIGHRDLKLGKLIIILAGSTPIISKAMKSAKSMQNNSNNDASKLTDLLSRINGGEFKIPPLDLHERERDRRIDKICLSISLLQQRFGKNLQLIPWPLLRFIAKCRFRYGVRSIAHLIDTIQVPNSFLYGDSARETTSNNSENSISMNDLNFPFDSVTSLKNSSLAYHLLIEADEEPDTIIETWNSIKTCKTLVRFQEEERPEEI